MTVPYGAIEYNEGGEFVVMKPDNNYTRKVNKIGMIAGGTGISPMFQLIQKIISTKENTGMSLIYCAKSIEDLAFCEDLVKYDRSGRLTFYPVVETANVSNWMYGVGRLNPSMIEKYMPSPKGNFKMKNKLIKNNFVKNLYLHLFFILFR